MDSMDSDDGQDNLKRKRGPNFTPNDVSLLLDIATKYREILENNQTNKTTTKLKESAWLKIEKEFNASAPSYPRDVVALKRCYENKKKTAKMKQAKMRRETFKTGGGAPPSPTSSNDEKVLAIINKKKVHGLPCQFGGDGLDKCSGSGGCSGMNTDLTRESEDNIEFVFEDEDFQESIWNSQPGTSKSHFNWKTQPGPSKTSSNRNKFSIMDDSEYKGICGDRNGYDQDAESTTKAARKRQMFFEDNNSEEENYESQGGRGEQRRRTRVESNQGVEALGEREEERREENRNEVGVGDHNEEQGNRERGRIPARGAHRRPRTFVRALTTSDLANKYNSLLDKRLVIADFQKKQLEDQIRIQKEEHELKKELLRSKIEKERP